MQWDVERESEEGVSVLVGFKVSRFQNGEITRPNREETRELPLITARLDV